MAELRLETVESAASGAQIAAPRAERLPQQEWLRRFMAQIHSVSGFNVDAAAMWPEGYDGLCKGFESDPEAAASAQLRYWLD